MSRRLTLALIAFAALAGAALLWKLHEKQQGRVGAAFPPRLHEEEQRSVGAASRPRSGPSSSSRPHPALPPPPRRGEFPSLEGRGVGFVRGSILHV
jgi:hypothetical protein